VKGSFHDLLEAAPDAMLVVNSRGQIVLVNAQTEKLFGYKRDELLNQRLEILMPHRFRLQHDVQRDQFFGNPHSRPMGSGLELIALRKDGSEFPVDITLSPVKTEEGIVVLSSIRDITERKANEELARQNAEMKIKMAEENAELAAAKRELKIVAERERVSEALRKSEARVRRLVDSNIIGICTGDLNGKLLDANDAFLDMLGFTREDLKSDQMRWDVLRPPEYREMDRIAIDRLKTTGAASPWETQFFRKDGSRMFALIGVATLVAESGDLEAISFVLDLSEQKRLEQQLRQAQKVEAIGQLAGGIAHDFNNLLAVIIGYSEMFEEQLSESDPLRPKAEQIRKAGQRAAALTRQLLAFSRKQVLEPTVLDLNAVIADTLKMLSRLIGEDIELVAVPAPDLGRVKADHGQIEQVILNLAVNARDAMPQGGRLTITTENAEMDEVFVRQHAGAVPGSYVMLAVTDNGCGMDHETQTHIFEPFFTTKGEGKGTGLGLATVFGVVKQSGGYVSVYSELGQGTSFKVYLPRTDDFVAAAAKPGKGNVRGSETILIVEDAQPLRELARELLEASGYTVLEAINGEDAIRVAEKHRGHIHLLLSDVVMPIMGGWKLTEHMLRMYPDMKMLYMSGYTDEFMAHHGVLDSGVALLQKPFTKESLMSKVREVLGVAKNQSEMLADGVLQEP
jgi:two-component system, cell cycle sensor histidine kinase and response regulator CckA